MRGTLRTAIAAVLLSTLVIVATAADPAVRVPSAPVAPQPVPTPVRPDAPVRLAGDEWFVIDSDVPCVVLVSPDGLATLVEDVGPLRVRGKFAAGTGAIETRAFKGKYIYLVTAAKTGRAELFVYPDGAKKASDVIRRLLDVDVGTPPDVGPKVDPVPDAVPALFPGDGLRVYVVYESADLAKYPAAQVNAMSAGVVREYLNSKVPVGPDGKTYEYRFLDQNVVPDVPAFTTVHKKARTTLPWVYASNGKPGAINNYDGPLPADTHAFLAMLKRIGG